jgi:hypothetical protein
VNKIFFPSSVEIDIRPRQNFRLILPYAEIISVLPEFRTPSGKYPELGSTL